MPPKSNLQKLQDSQNRQSLTLDAILIGSVISSAERFSSEALEKIFDMTELSLIQKGYPKDKVKQLCNSHRVIAIETKKQLKAIE